jgi:hypothetical protein
VIVSGVWGADVTPDATLHTRALGSSYVVETIIGRGATGEVWRGHVRDTQEPIAAKVLHAQLRDDPAMVAAFIRERTLLTGIDHPNVVRVRDLVIEGDTVALVTDLVDGPSARVVLDRDGAMTTDDAVALVDAVLSGLAAVHAHGLVHRDLKPENVLLPRDGGPPQVADFGIAGPTTPDLGPRTPVLGSVAYIAPELTDGRSATPASDLYAVGVMLYELVSGETPFASAHPIAVVDRHLHHRPTRPEAMPSDVWHVVERLLAKEPADRPASADHARALLTGTAPVGIDAPSAPRASTPPAVDGPTIITGQDPRLGARSPTRRRVVTAGTAALAAALVVAFVTVVLPGRTGRAAATLVSAPEYWDVGGKPVVHRSTTFDGRTLRVGIRVANVPVGGFTVREYLPASVRGRPITVDGKPAHPNADGVLHLRVRYRPSIESHVSYTVRRPSITAPSRFLRRYERARVRAVRAATPARRPLALAGLEIAPSLRLPAHASAWLPAAGVTTTGDLDARASESLGRGWVWRSSDARVASVTRRHPAANDPTRDRSATYYALVTGRPGRARITTIVGGRPYTIRVRVERVASAPTLCEPGVVPGSHLRLTRAGGVTHPIEGTLVAFEPHGGPTMRVLGGRLLPLHGRPCPNASVVHRSLAEYARATGR